MEVAWAGTQIRFEERQQWIDVTDVLSVIYKTKEVAGVKQSVFLSPATIDKTAALCECEPDQIIHKVFWMDAARERTCVSVAHMHTMLKTIKNIPAAKELAAILDVGELTVTTAHRFKDKDKDTGTTPVDQAVETERVTTDEPFTLTRADIFKHGNSRLVESYANTMLRTSNMEATARQKQLDMEHLKCTAAEWDLGQDLESKQRKRMADEMSQKRMLEADKADTKHKNKLANTINAMIKIGQHAKAEELTEQLMKLD